MMIMYAASAMSGAAVYFFVSDRMVFGVYAMYVVVAAALLVSLLMRTKMLSRLNVSDVLLAFMSGLAVSLIVSGFGYQIVSLTKINYSRCADMLMSGAQVLRIWMLSHGMSIYPPLGTNAHMVSIYPPGYFVLGAFVDVFARDPYVSAIVVNSLSAVAICGVMFLWARKEKSSLLVSSLVVVMYLSQYWVLQIIREVKPDILGVAVALFGSFLFFNGREKRSSIIVSGVVLALVVFIKQQLAVAIVGCVTYCLVRPSYFKRCFFVGLVTLLTSAVVLAFLVFVTDGHYLEHTLLYPLAMSSKSFISNWDNAIPRYKSFALESCGLLTVLVLSLVQDVVDKRVHILTWMCVVSSGFAAVFLRHWGAGSNYYWFFLSIACLRAGSFMSVIERLGRSWRVVWVAMVALIFASSPNARQVMGLMNQSVEFNVALDGVDKIIAERGFENILMYSEGSTSALGRSWIDRVTFFDSLDLAYYERAGLLKFYDSQLANELVGKKFDAVVIGGSFVSQSFLWFMLDSYRRDAKSGDVTTYLRRDGDVVLYSQPSDSPFARKGLSIRLAESVGVYSTPGFGAYSFTLHDGSSSSYVTFELQSERDMKSVFLAFIGLAAHPGPENRLVVEVSTDGSNFSKVYEYIGVKGDMDKGFFDGRRETEFPVNGRKIWVRFVLIGSGQLWYSEDYPICFSVR